MHDVIRSVRVVQMASDASELAEQAALAFSPRARKSVFKRFG